VAIYCEDDNERLGLITAIHATTLRGSFRGAGPAPFEFGLFGGAAPGQVAATGPRRWLNRCFTDLAQNVHKLKPDTILTAWLYQVTRRTAIDVVRRENRRQFREQIASEMNA